MTDIDDEKELRIAVSGKMVHKAVHNYLRNSSETQAKIQALVDKLAMEEALFSRIEHLLVQKLIEKYSKGRDFYKLQNKVLEELEQRMIADRHINSLITKWITKKLNN